MLQVPSSHRSSSTYASAGPGYVSATAGAGAQAAAHVDIDAPTAHDPTQFVEYVQDIYKHYRKDEVSCLFRCLVCCATCVLAARRPISAARRLSFWRGRLPQALSAVL